MHIALIDDIGRADNDPDATPVTRAGTTTASNPRHRRTLSGTDLVRQAARRARKPRRPRMQVSTRHPIRLRRKHTNPPVCQEDGTATAQPPTG